jgi:serine/threonine protein kinase
VNIGLNILTGRVVAIKSFNKKIINKNGDNMKKILYETNLMKKLNHSNITKILEMFEDEDYILIAMEYINGGNLFSFVKKRRKLSEKTAKFLFRQIILGIKHIHSQNIVHRDIKLENILIDLNNNIKICDFGIGRILSSKKQLLHDKCGTPMYMAPEILLSSKTRGYEGFPVDIWSSGISLYIMLAGSLPYNYKKDNSASISSDEKTNNIELQYNIIHKEPKKIEHISKEAKDLLKGLLNKNPNKRLTIEQILNHPWLKMDEKIKNNKNYHLFTKAEMIMLSKTYIDYRNGSIDDLKENFTISNLKKEKKEQIKENVTDRSILLAPYNTLIQEREPKSIFNDFHNPYIHFENDIMIFNNKVKEYNLNYELNNNGECDNGILINSKTGTISSGVANNSFIREVIITDRSKRRNENDEYDIDENGNGDEDIEEEQIEKKKERILNQIEKIGYDKEYVINCVNKNILCHASAIFYLMFNYENI